ncbi:hypothetical protein BCO23253_02838 [Burkholderia contaminans]|nr:hypothetical protein SK875_B02504 [Burkholderia contaminans]VWB60565.1 hypothetical protein BCO23253_02838 [Burkholderia contaminans]
MHESCEEVLRLELNPRCKTGVSTDCEKMTGKADVSLELRRREGLVGEICRVYRFLFCEPMGLR